MDRLCDLYLLLWILTPFLAFLAVGAYIEEHLPERAKEWLWNRFGL